MRGQPWGAVLRARVPFEEVERAIGRPEPARRRAARDEADVPAGRQQLGREVMVRGQGPAPHRCARDHRVVEAREHQRRAGELREVRSRTGARVVVGGVAEAAERAGLI